MSSGFTGSGKKSGSGQLGFNTQEFIGAPVERTGDDYLVAHIDGGARGNPGPAGYGVVIEDHAGRRIDEFYRYLGRQTNNYAEYSGLIAALEYALQNHFRALKILSDSELLVRQMKGIYKVRALPLQELYAKARALIRELDWFAIEHIPREQNTEADHLANMAMDRAMFRSH
ncbi:MAG: ribonuclease HI family protein [Acidobacteria bacterium]|nr:ribonuclease HI family protein [Acidobacteriota bacterium]